MDAPSTRELQSPAPFAQLQRRRARRYLCEGTAEAIIITHKAEILLRGVMLDISLNGCFVQTHAPAHLILECEAEIRFKIRGQIYKCAALVRNVQPRVGTGFEFRHLTAPVKARIRALIKELANEESGTTT